METVRLRATVKMKKDWDDKSENQGAKNLTLRFHTVSESQPPTPCVNIRGYFYFSFLSQPQ